MKNYYKVATSILCFLAIDLFAATPTKDTSEVNGTTVIVESNGGDEEPYSNDFLFPAPGLAPWGYYGNGYNGYNYNYGSYGDWNDYHHGNWNGYHNSNWNNDHHGNWNGDHHGNWNGEHHGGEGNHGGGGYHGGGGGHGR